MQTTTTTLRDSQRFDNLVEDFLNPNDKTPSPIGELCRRGGKVFYAFLDGIYYEAPSELQVAQKLATKHIGK